MLGILVLGSLFLSHIEVYEGMRIITVWAPMVRVRVSGLKRRFGIREVADLNPRLHGLV